MTTEVLEQPVSIAPPSLYDWAGGMAALEKLTGVFYDKVKADPLLQPVFEHMDPAHPQHVARFLGEVFGGPKMYSEGHGGHAEMIRHHLGRHLQEAQRRRWVTLLIDAADEIGLPDDPEFRSSFVSYIEWGTRLAVINSQPGAEVVEDQPMPQWGWGETKALRRAMSDAGEPSQSKQPQSKKTNT